MAHVAIIATNLVGQSIRLVHHILLRHWYCRLCIWAAPETHPKREEQVRLRILLEMMARSRMSVPMTPPMEKRTAISSQSHIASNNRRMDR